MRAEVLELLPDGGSHQAYLATGESVLMRPIKIEDTAILGIYFLALSDVTRQFYSPHPFDQETADRLCADANTGQALRMLGILNQEDPPTVIAYFIVNMEFRVKERERFAGHGLSLDPASVCSFAPSVADDFQDSGVGSLVMAHVVEVLRLLGKKHIVLQGGVQERNRRAVHFYKKFGFNIVGEFETRIKNYDMIVTL